MSQFKSTLGILAGMGPRASAHFQNLLIEEFGEKEIYEDGDFPTIITLSIPLEEWDNKGSKDKQKVSAQVNAGIDWLKQAGADVIAVPCNTVHEFIEDKTIVNIIHSTL